MKGSSLQSAGPHATRYVGREHAALRDVRGRGKGVMCRCSVCRAKVFARFLGTRPTSPRAAAGPMSRSRTGSCCTLWGHEVALLRYQDARRMVVRVDSDFCRPTSTVIAQDRDEEPPCAGGCRTAADFTS